MNNNEYAPFQTKESRDAILLFWNTKLTPQIEKMRSLALTTARYCPIIFHIISRSEIKNIEKDYNTILERFLDLYQKFKAPMFEGGIFENSSVDYKNPSNQEKIIIMAVDYKMADKTILGELFDEGFCLIDMIDKQITRKRQILDQYLAIGLSIIAIIVSLLVAFFLK